MLFRYRIAALFRLVEFRNVLPIIIMPGEHLRLQRRGSPHFEITHVDASERLRCGPQTGIQHNAAHFHPLAQINGEHMSVPELAARQPGVRVGIDGRVPGSVAHIGKRPGIAYDIARQPDAGKRLLRHRLIIRRRSQLQGIGRIPPVVDQTRAERSLFGLEPTERLLHLFEPGETVFVVPEFAVLILNEECDSDLRVEAILPKNRHAAEIGHHRKRLPDEVKRSSQGFEGFDNGFRPHSVPGNGVESNRYRIGRSKSFHTNGIAVNRRSFDAFLTIPFILGHDIHDLFGIRDRIRRNPASVNRRYDIIFDHGRLRTCRAFISAASGHRRQRRRTHKKHYRCIYPFHINSIFHYHPNVCSKFLFTSKSLRLNGHRYSLNDTERPEYTSFRT